MQVTVSCFDPAGSHMSLLAFEDCLRSAKTDQPGMVVFTMKHRQTSMTLTSQKMISDFKNDMREEHSLFICTRIVPQSET